MEPESTTREHKGKGGNLLKATSEFFENKYKAAAANETQIHQCLAADSGLPREGDEDMLVTRTLLDSMEPDAHANVILATDFDQPGAFENPELSEALRRMTISEDGSWQEVDKYTDTSSEADRTWTKVRHSDAMEVVQVEVDTDSQRSRSRRAPQIQGRRPRKRGAAKAQTNIESPRFRTASLTLMRIARGSHKE